MAATISHEARIGRRAPIAARSTSRPFSGRRTLGISGENRHSITSFQSVVSSSTRRLLADHATLSSRRSSTMSDETAYFESVDRWSAAEGGYAHLQGTMPQTLAYPLNDAPARLAAYIVEKFRAWSDCDGDLARVCAPDTRLTNIASSWCTRTIGSSMHLCWERQRAPMQPPRDRPRALARPQRGKDPNSSGRGDRIRRRRDRL